MVFFGRFCRHLGRLTILGLKTTLEQPKPCSFKLARDLQIPVQMENTLNRIPAYDALEFGAAALKLRTYRHELLSANLVNADTPNYKAQDVNFASELQRQMSSAGTSRGMGLTTSHSGHIAGGLTRSDVPATFYRIPVQPSVDGNTVDPDIERGHFMKNALMTEGALGFLSSTIRTRLSAITGQAS